MMYPRIRLAKELLAPNGVIFVSIDDNEAHNLRQIMNEVFGEENFLAQFTWVKKKKGSHLSKTIRDMTEYVIAFAGNSDGLELFGEDAYSDKWQPLAKRTNAVKTLAFPACLVKTTLRDGSYESGRYGVGTSSIKFEAAITVKAAKIINQFEVSGPFVWTQTKLDEELKNGTTVALSSKFGFNVFRYNQDEKIKRPSTLLDAKVEVGTNEDANQELIQIFKREGIMSYPKPTSLIKYLVRSVTHFDKSGIVLDFFAGSGTTGHAVWELNKEDHGDRKFILVQLPEPCPPGSNAAKAGYTTIADICKDRLTRTSKNLAPRKGSIEFSFRVLKLRRSNFRIWEDYTGQDLEKLEEKLNLFEVPLVKGWKTEDLICEILLLEGFPLDSDSARIDKLAKNTIYQIKSDEGGHRLLVSLDARIDPDTLKRVNVNSDDVFICLDGAISDQSKQYLADRCKLRTI
jgi:adenine-specific DNA-methyltransferase